MKTTNPDANPDTCTQNRKSPDPWFVLLLGFDPPTHRVDRSDDAVEEWIPLINYEFWAQTLQRENGVIMYKFMYVRDKWIFPSRARSHWDLKQSWRTCTHHVPCTMYTPVPREARKSANALDVHPQIFSYSNDSEQDLNETDQDLRQITV